MIAGGLLLAAGQPDPCGRVPAFPLVTPDGTPTPTLTDLRILRQRWLA